MEEVKIEKKLKQLKTCPESAHEESDDPFNAFDSLPNIDMSLSSVLRPKSPKKERVIVRKRSQTVTSPTEPPGSRKSLQRGKFIPEYEQRRNSTFYISPVTTDVTTPFVLPMMDMGQLVVSNRSQEELLDLIAIVM